MATDAQKRATARYERDHVKVIQVKVFPKDADLWAWYQGHENRQEYVRQLIREDMRANGAG